MDVVSLGYRTDLAIRRAEGSQVSGCGDHIVVRTERNPGYWWGNFIPLARRLAGDDDWRQSAALRLACFEADPAVTAAAPGVRADEQEFDARKLAARRQLTESGQAAWFGAFAASRLVAQLGLVPAGNGLARYQDVESIPGSGSRGWPGRWSGRPARTAWRS
jgi:hypothetical protein